MKAAIISEVLTVKKNDYYYNDGMSKELKELTVIGGGLAGSEAAWQAAQRGINVNLYEMRPFQHTPAHKTELLAELVCSNSLKAASLDNASGLLKEELRRQDSLIMRCADQAAVPAGGALAVDRKRFSLLVTDAICNEPKINLIREEICELPDSPVLVASGPLTSEKLCEQLQKMIGGFLYFYDAAAPIVTLESLDQDKIFRASRYEKGDAAYLNCPLNEDEYSEFYHALIAAERYPLKEFEKEKHFEGCMPVEVLAARGYDTLRFGPLKPVGLKDPKTGYMPYAVVQLRQDDASGSLFNLVGFQTNLRWGEQKRVFGMIPGLENAEYIRYGVMHRNIYIDAPRVLKPTWQIIRNEKIFIAGQLSGVEGYLESTISGLQAGINAARLLQDKPLLIWPETTIGGALTAYITNKTGSKFQPMNANFGILPPLKKRIRNKKEHKLAMSERALQSLDEFEKHMIS